MASRSITKISLAALILAVLAGQASASFFTNPRLLKGQSKADISACAGGELVARTSKAWTYRSVGSAFYKHIWRNRPPRLSIPGGEHRASVGFVPPILRKNRCDVTFRFKNGAVSGVNFSTNVRGTQAEFTCGIVTDYCLRR
ncbi:hypothetical protein MNBD_ALPHA04-582 [hydrothermal vent metagenome]|uniref:Uncharacterized protein n=1 Tax=hydrothermal vent metagenome TaxID=652676 RepID=A0A3B0STX5_9ZZZZ